MKAKLILRTALVLLAAYALALPYLTINQMRTAARQRDAAALALAQALHLQSRNFRYDARHVLRDSRFVP